MSDVTMTAQEQIAAGTKQNLHDLWLWDVAEKQRALRAVDAIGYGLSPHDYSRPFPGSSSSSLQVRSTREAGGSQDKPPAPWGDLAKVAVVACALGGAAMAGASLVAKLLSLSSSNSASKMEPQEYEVFFESDGKKIEVKRP